MIILEGTYDSNINMMTDLTLAWRLLKLNGILILRDSTPDQSCESKKLTVDSFLNIFPSRDIFRKKDGTLPGARPIVLRHCGNTIIRKYLPNMKVFDETSGGKDSKKMVDNNKFGLDQFMRGGSAATVASWRGKIKK